MVVPNKSQTSKNQKCHTKGFLSPHLTGLTNWWPRAQNCQRAFWFESYSRFVFFFFNWKQVPVHPEVSRKLQISQDRQCQPCTPHGDSCRGRAVVSPSPGAWAGALQSTTCPLQSLVPSWPPEIPASSACSLCKCFFLKFN